MIVSAVGLTSELVAPAATPRGTRAAQVAWPPPVDWLVLSMDRFTRECVLASIRRDGRTSHAALARTPSRSMTRCGPRYRCGFVDLLHAVGDDGEIGEWLQALRLQRTRLVLRGADGDFDHECRAREAGAVAYLPGEVDPRGLGRLVADVARRAG